MGIAFAAFLSVQVLAGTSVGHPLPPPSNTVRTSAPTHVLTPVHCATSVGHPMLIVIKTHRAHPAGG